MTRTELVAAVTKRIGRGDGDAEVLEAIRLELLDYDAGDAKRRAAGMGPYRYQGGSVMWLERAVLRRLAAGHGG